MTYLGKHIATPTIASAYAEFKAAMAYMSADGLPDGLPGRHS